jgi:hypothetical protein
LSDAERLLFSWFCPEHCQLQTLTEQYWEWLSTFLPLPNGIPCADTFARVFARLEEQQLQKCFGSWVKAISNLVAGENVGIDGKTLRRSYDKSRMKQQFIWLVLGLAAIISSWDSAKLRTNQTKLAPYLNY